MMLLLFTFCHLGEEMTRKVTNLMSYVISLLFRIVKFRHGRSVYNLIAAYTGFINSVEYKSIKRKPSSDKMLVLLPTIKGIHITLSTQCLFLTE